MNRTPARVVAVLVVAATLAFPSPAAADGGVSWPDERGDAGGAPDIIGLSVSMEADVLVLAVDFADAPPITSAPDDTSTDVLMLFVDSAGGEPDGPAHNGFTLGLFAVEGPEGAVFSAIRDGQTGLEEAGVASAHYDGPSVVFRLPADRLPDAPSIGIRVVTLTYGGGGDTDSLPDGDAWTSLSRADLAQGTGGRIAIVLWLIGGLLVGGGPLIWIAFRARRMRQRLERESLRPTIAPSE